MPLQNAACVVLFFRTLKVEVEKSLCNFVEYDNYDVYLLCYFLNDGIGLKVPGYGKN